MKRTARDLALVGAFVLVTGTILVGALLWLAGANIFRRVDTYQVMFERSVSGLAPGATVEFQGVTAGRVQDIVLTDDIPPKVAVTIEVEPDTPIQKDTRAELIGSVVTGIKFIALGGGTMAAGRLDPGGTINGTVASFERLGDQVAQIASRVLDIVDRLDKEVFTEDKNKKLGKLVDDIASLAATLRATIDPLREEETGKDLARLVSDVRRASNNIDGLVSDLRKSQSTVLTDATDALRGIQGVASETNALIRSVRGELAGTGTSLGALISDLTEATNRLEETLTVIQADPSLLLRGRPKRLEDRP